ncbi:hypothetical protein B0H10DRAFT_929726 [Mycena sp. CBHHK59/15]|nr:hypothetical protein B0H10DRAFT_929726 [Mycena sp. CBHHK59/15]
MKFLYLFIRYIPLCIQISILLIGSPELTPHFHFSPHDCFIWQVYQGVATVLVFAAVDYVLILREFTGMCVGLGLSLPGIQFDDICLVTHISMREGWGDLPIVVLVMRDGTWAFFLLFAVVGGDASLYALKNHTFSSVLYGWLLSVFSFSGYRVLLNLDRLGASPRLPTSLTTSGSTQMQLTTRIITDREPELPDSYELAPLNASSSSGLG